MNMPGTIGGAKLIFNSRYPSLPSMGIVGLGSVGNAIRQSASDHVTVIGVDSNAAKSTHQFEQLAACEGIFVCVPTPSSIDGSCDTSMLESVLAKLLQLKYTGVIISKCTAPPDVYERLNQMYPNLVHCPEWLTSANAVNDYANGIFVVIGGRIKAYQDQAEKIIKWTQPHASNIYHCTIKEASLAKYAINTFLATKVVFMNELHQLAAAMGADYATIANMMTGDARVGNSHMRVPGPDGSFGYGGACFPKDVASLLSIGKNADVQLNLLTAASKKNLILRLHE